MAFLFRWRWIRHFIVDEALSVGDKGFAQKCLKRMMKLRMKKNKTILFISHSLPQVKEFCKTAIWIEGGKLIETGEVNEVCKHYSEYVDELNSLSDKEKKKRLEEKFKERLIVEEKKSKLSRIIKEIFLEKDEKRGSYMILVIKCARIVLNFIYLFFKLLPTKIKLP